MQDTALAMSRPSFDALDNVALLHEVKTLVGRCNSITAHLLAHLAEVDARGAYLEVACPSLYKYCIYELRMSEDAAQRRVQAARAVRHFPVLLDMLTDASIHLTGILLLAPHPDARASGCEAPPAARGTVLRHRAPVARPLSRRAHRGPAHHRPARRSPRPARASDPGSRPGQGA